MDVLNFDRDGLMLVIVVASFALIGLIVFGITLLGKPARQMRKRVERAVTQQTPKAVSARQANVRRDRSDASIASLDRLAKTLIPNPQQMRVRLARTGKRITLGVYLLISMLVGGIFVIAAMKLLNLDFLPALLIGIAAGMLLPHMFIGMLINRRQKKFISTFPDAIDVIVRGLRSGLPATESMTIVSRELTGPVADEFSHIGHGMKLGQTLEEILWETAQRVDVPEFRFFVISISIQRETGGNLAETLENLSDVLRKRQQMRLKVRALSSEARASAMIIAALPFVMMGIIMMVNSGYIMQLFEDDRGIAMLVGAGISLCTGIIVMAKMIKFEI